MVISFPAVPLPPDDLGVSKDSHDVQGGGHVIDHIHEARWWSATAC